MISSFQPAANMGTALDSRRVLVALRRLPPRVRLTPFEIRFALFSERLQSFFPVVGKGEHVADVGLGSDAVGERHVEAPVDRLLDHHHRELRILGYLSDNLTRLLE